MDLTFTQQVQQFAANHPIMIAAWVGLFVAVVVMFYKGATSKFKVIDNNEAVRLINKEEGVVVDLRSDDEFRAGHIIDSHHLLPSQIKSNNTQPIDKFKDRPVILVDLNGLTAGSNANLLVKAGFSKVFVLKDGISAWRTGNLPLVKKHK
ncbi:rhodanese-like domain-containing protein [Pasteurellaceae bacterium RH1A]|nr:rhodanese-like domain-containing protein [Pasteurellaceae bacterium RH1A]